MAGNRGDAKPVLLPVETIAQAFEFARQLAAVQGAGILLRFVKLPADDRAPGSVTARREIEDEAMGMKLRIGFAAGVVIELRHQEPGGPFPQAATMSASCPGGGALEMPACGKKRRL